MSRSRVELPLQFSNFFNADRTFALVGTEYDMTKGYGTRVEIRPHFEMPYHGRNYFFSGPVVVNSCRGLVCLMDASVDEKTAIVCNC